MDLRGVCGMLELPDGPGELWPLLLAAQWLHVGKGTVMGLGRLDVEPCRGRGSVAAARCPDQGD
ncbi:MAG: CRISPR system precrRNA processing endoribonuclease RAMP protein Cas6 [Planctomycetota bacterium]